MGNAFVSYSRRDQQFVRKLVDRLQNHGHELWVDWEGIPLTADWMKEIETGIENANDFIFVISPDSVQSEICHQEIEHAIKYNKRLVPILFRELEDSDDKAALHPHISSHNWIFLRDVDDFERAFEALTSALDTDLQYVRAHTRLLARAIEWGGKERDPSFLLRGSDLLEAEACVKDGTQEGKTPSINEIQQAYVSASRQAETWRRRERLFLGIIAAAFVLALIMLGVAVWQFLQAEDARAETQRLSLASNAQVALGNSNTDLAVSLALIANGSGNPRGETERALADSAYSPGTRFRFTAHEASVSVAKFSEHGDLAASADESGILILWNAQTLEIVRTFEGHEGVINGVDISRNLQWVVSGGADGSVRLWSSINEDTMIMRLEEASEDYDEPSAVRAVAFDSTGSRILTGYDNGVMALWDVETGDLIQTFTDGHEGAVISVSFHPDEPLALSFALSSTSNTQSSALIIWDLETGEQVDAFDDFRSIGQNIAQGAAVFSPDGEHVLSSNAVDLLYWNWRTGELIWTLSGHGSNINSIAFDRNGRYALSSGRLENSVRYWDVLHGVELRRLDGHAGVVQFVSINDDGRYALSASEDMTVRVWDLANGAQVMSYNEHTDQAYGVDISPDDRLVASSSDDDTIHLWNINEGADGEVTILEGHEADIWRVAFNFDGTLLISGSEDQTARIWDVATGDTLHELIGHSNNVTTVDFNSDSTLALTGSNDQTIRVWDVTTGEQQLCFGQEGTIDGCTGDSNGQVRSVAFSTDNSLILVGDDNARLINPQTGAELWRSDGTVHADRVNSAVFNADGSQFVTGSADGTIAVWTTQTVRDNPEGAEPDQYFTGHSGQIRSVVFTPNGRRILSASADFTMRLWDVASGLEVRRFESHTNWVSQAAITSDGQLAVSAGWDRRVIVWHIDDVQQMTAWVCENRYVRPLTLNELRTYRTEQLATCVPPEN
ncbi:MAG: TIR domain-containing protein [Aggregatilineales bacterium]